jgi:hypothetical protein
MKSYTPETWPFQYYLKPCNIDSKSIFNLRGPESFGPVGWDAATKKAKKQAAEEWIAKVNTSSNNWFQKLENSILEEGFLNPIIVHAGLVPKREIGKLPKKHWRDQSELFVCYSLGGNRLYVAQKHNLDIPCLVCDYNNLVPGVNPLYTIPEVQACWTNPPIRMDFKPHGLVVWGVDQGNASLS